MSLGVTIGAAAAVSFIMDVGSSLTGAHVYNKHLKGKKLKILPTIRKSHLPKKRRKRSWLP